MRLCAGTSGFSYKEWKGSFYPEKLSSPEMLRFYASKLPAVEINNTFYRMPKPEVLASWAARVPADFRFVLKASRRITHQQQLRDSADSVAYLFKVAAILEQRLGPVLFQLPPFLKKDVPRLSDFLAMLPDGCRAAFEFREPSWFDDEVYETLRAHSAALVGGDMDDPRRSPPLVATADWGYLRLRAADYSDADLDRWAATLGEQPWREAYAFFKHETRGPELALALNARFDAGSGPGVERPKAKRPGVAKPKAKQKKRAAGSDRDR